MSEISTNYLKAEYVKVHHDNDMKFTNVECVISINDQDFGVKLKICDGLLNEEEVVRGLSRDKFIRKQLAKIITNELLKIDINE